MRTIILVLLPFLLCSCAAAHDASTALDVTSTSTAARARLWPAVNAAVRSVASEGGLHRQSVVHRPPPSGVVESYAPPPNQSQDMTLFVFHDGDRAGIEIIETGVRRPSPKHRELQHLLTTRLQAAGLTVATTEPRTVVTY